MGMLEEYLKKLRADELKAVASLWHINDFEHIRRNDIAYQKKRLMIKEMIRRMRDEDRIKSVVLSLSDREQHILGIFALNNWLISRSELSLWDITEDELGISPFTAEQSDAEMKGLLGSLLIVRSRKYRDVGAIVYVVPEELRDGITAALSSEEEAEVRDRNIRRISDVRRGIMEDILVFLSHANTGIPLTPSFRKIRKRYAEKIMSELSEKSQRHLLFIRRVCEMLDIVRQNTHNKIMLKTTDKAEKFMRKSREERMLEILRAFSRSYDGIKRIVLDELRKLKPDVWYDRALFERNVRSAVFRKSKKEWFYFKRSAVSSVIRHLMLLGLADIGMYERITGSDVVEDRRARSAESSDEHGVIEVRRRRGGARVERISLSDEEECASEAAMSSWDVFRLKSAFFGLHDDADSHEKTLIVQPNFEIIAYPETSDDVIFSLTRFASLKNADRVATFVITKESVMRAMERGMSASDILNLLREHARNEIPQNILFTIRSWCDMFGKAVLKRCLFVRTEPEVMEMLKKWINMTEIADGCGICDKNAFEALICMREVFVIDVDDDATAAAVESMLNEAGVHVRRHANKFLIDREDVSACVSALRRRGMFPKIMMSDEEDCAWEK